LGSIGVTWWAAGAWIGGNAEIATVNELRTWFLIFAFAAVA
jgi:hypothetical protein